MPKNVTSVYMITALQFFIHLTLIPVKVLRHVRSYMGHSHPLAMAIGLWMCLEPTVAIAIGTPAPQGWGSRSKLSWHNFCVLNNYWCRWSDVSIFLATNNDYDNWIDPGLNPPTSCIDVGSKSDEMEDCTTWGQRHEDCRYALRVSQGLASFGHWARLIVPGSTARQNPWFTELRSRYPSRKLPSLQQQVPVKIQSFSTEPLWYDNTMVTHSKYLYIFYIYLYIVL